MPLLFVAVVTVCQFTALLNVLGYEYSSLIAILVAIYAGVAAALRSRQASINGDSVVGAFLNVLARGLAMVAVALIVSVCATYFFRQCHIGGGLKLFAFITLPTLFHFAALGVLLGVLFKKRTVAIAVLFLYVIACAAHSAYQFWWAQQVPSNLILGFVNGSGYAGFSDDLFWTPAFVYFRVLTVLMGAGYLAIAFLKQNAIAHKWTRSRSVAATVLLIMLIAVCVALVWPDKWGIGNGRTRIAERLGKTYETEHVVLHYAADTPVAAHIAQIAEDHEWFFHQLSATLNHTPTWKVQSYIYATPSQMEEATGAEGYVFTQPWHHEIHIPYDDRSDGVERDTLKHEMVHLIMGDFGDRFLNVNLNRGILEGTAVAIADDLFRGPGFQDTAAAARESGHLTPATVLFSQSGFGFGDASISKSYTLSGSFIGFLIDRYGVGKLESLYKTSDFTATYAKSLQVLDKEWTDYLATVHADEREVKRISYLYDDTIFRPLFKNECPRIGSREVSPYELANQLLRDKRYSEAIILYRDIYRREGNNPRWLIRIAEIYKLQADYKNAIDTLKTAAESPRLPHTILEDAIRSLFELLITDHRWNDAADLLAEAEKRDAGTPEWREVRRRLLGATPAVRDAAFQGMYESKSDVAIRNLNHAIELEPSFGIPYLLLAERIGRKDGVIPAYFDSNDKFLQLTPGLESLKTRVLLSLGNLRYEQGNWPSAESYFRQASELSTGVQQKQVAGDWLDRLRWRETWPGARAMKSQRRQARVNTASIRNYRFGNTF